MSEVVKDEAFEGPVSFGDNARSIKFKKIEQFENDLRKKMRVNCGDEGPIFKDPEVRRDVARLLGHLPPKESDTKSNAKSAGKSLPKESKEQKLEIITNSKRTWINVLKSVKPGNGKGSRSQGLASVAIAVDCLDMSCRCMNIDVCDISAQGRSLQLTD